jgi:hypothetical protein
MLIIIDDFKYFTLSSMENYFFDNMEILPLWIQKLGRIAKLIINVTFISGSKHFSIADYVFRSKTYSNQNDITSNDRIFASRQEIFSLIYVKSI